MEARRLEERIRVILLYIEYGKKIDEIADVMDVSIRTIRRWVKAYREGYISIFLDVLPNLELDILFGDIPFLVMFYGDMPLHIAKVIKLFSTRSAFVIII